jgi:hypothetical protein
MFDRYIQWTREHQAELQLDAVNQRLLAQIRLTAPTRVPRSRDISRLAVILSRFTVQLRWCLAKMQSAQTEL